MKKLALTLALAFAFACTAFAQVAADSQASSSASGNPSATAGQNSAALASGTTMGATLNKSVDARHAKVGDQVTAKTTEAVQSDGKVVIPKVGHSACGRAHGWANSAYHAGSAGGRVAVGWSSSRGHGVGLHFICAERRDSTARGEGLDAGMKRQLVASFRGRGGTGGVTRIWGCGTRNTGCAAHTSQLTARSTGVMGMPGLALSTQFSTAAQGSVITSSTQNVHLDGGTQMVLRLNRQ